MIDAIQNSAYAVWVRESPSIWAYTTILSLHAMGLAIIVGINTIVALRLLGYVPDIPINKLRAALSVDVRGVHDQRVLGSVVARRESLERHPQLDVLREAHDDPVRDDQPRAHEGSTCSTLRP